MPKFDWLCVRCGARAETDTTDRPTRCAEPDCNGTMRRDYSSIRINRKFINQ